MTNCGVMILWTIPPGQKVGDISPPPPGIYARARWLTRLVFMIPDFVGMKQYFHSPCRYVVFNVSKYIIFLRF